MLTDRHRVEVSVVAAASGLDRPVRRVHISQLQDPAPWLPSRERLPTAHHESLRRLGHPPSRDDPALTARTPHVRRGVD